jgi:hypothetical protein
MATKKRNIQPPTQTPKQVVLDPVMYGTLIKYVGAAGAYSECDNCGKKTVRGMVRMKGDLMYCSITCIEKTIPRVQEISE